MSFIIDQTTVVKRSKDWLSGFDERHREEIRTWPQTITAVELKLKCRKFYAVARLVWAARNFSFYCVRAKLWRKPFKRPTPWDVSAIPESCRHTSEDLDSSPYSSQLLLQWTFYRSQKLLQIHEFVLEFIFHYFFSRKIFFGE